MKCGAESRNGVLDFYLLFAEVAVRMALAGEEKNVKKLMQIVFDLRLAPKSYSAVSQKLRTVNSCVGGK